MALELDALDRIADTVLTYDPKKKSEKNAKKARAPSLPAADNSSAGLKALQAANRHYRKKLWPAPYDVTTHQLHLGDARDLSWISDNSVHLVVTSPPYWTLKKY